MIVKMLSIAFMWFCIYSIIKPWDNIVIDVFEIDGFRVEINIRPSIGFMIERDCQEIYICFPFFSIDISWGKWIVKGGPRG